MRMNHLTYHSCLMWQMHKVTGKKCRCPNSHIMFSKNPSYVFRSIRENDPCNSTGDSTAGDRSERGAFSISESLDRTPSPGREIRRPEGRDGLIGKEHTI